MQFLVSKLPSLLFIAFLIFLFSYKKILTVQPVEIKAQGEYYQC